MILSGRPIFFRQKRIGVGGNVFWIWKWRTMVVGAEGKKQELSNKNEADGPVFKLRNDPRYTRIGRFLSHTGLDELPQLLNIIVGEMELVGPRPLPVEEAKQVKEKFKERQMVRPGIISPWVLDGYHRVKFDDWMKSDVEYVKNKSLVGDMVMILRGGWLVLGLILKEGKSIRI